MRVIVNGIGMVSDIAERCDETITAYIARVPLGWIAEAAKLPGRALHVGLTVMYAQSMNQGQEVILTRQNFKVMNIPRGADRRGMDALQQAGLIRYTKAGHSYAVNILPVKSNTKNVKDKTHDDFGRRLTTRPKTNGKTKPRTKTKETKTAVQQIQLPRILTDNAPQKNITFCELQEAIAKLNVLIAK